MVYVVGIIVIYDNRKSSRVLYKGARVRCKERRVHEGRADNRGEEGRFRGAGEEGRGAIGGRKFPRTLTTSLVLSDRPPPARSYWSAVWQSRLFRRAFFSPFGHDDDDDYDNA